MPDAGLIDARLHHILRHGVVQIDGHAPINAEHRIDHNRRHGGRQEHAHVGFSGRQDFAPQQPAQDQGPHEQRTASQLCTE
jgi:hypothetical protein